MFGMPTVRAAARRSTVECSMAEMVRDFYDDLASHYHLMFEDWEASMARQAAALGPILERGCGPANSVKILDCACGIGTQALGLAKLGFRVTGTDVSPRAIERARVEASARGLDLSLYVAACASRLLPGREVGACQSLEPGDEIVRRSCLSPQMEPGRTAVEALSHMAATRF